MSRKSFLKIRIATCFFTIWALAEHSPELVSRFWHFIVLLAVIGILFITIYGDIDEMTDLKQKKSAQGGNPKALS